jgi:hypothetical protein
MNPKEKINKMKNNISNKLTEKECSKNDAIGTISKLSSNFKEDDK